MATKRFEKEKEERPVTPFTDESFRSRSIHAGDLEFQRRFEQNHIRFTQDAAAASEEKETGAAITAEDIAQATAAQQSSAGAAGSSSKEELPYDTDKAYAGEGEFLSLTGSSGTAIRVGCIASATARNSNEDERSTSADVYTRVKAIRINEAIKGTIRVAYYLKTGDAMIEAFARLYLNDVALGIEHDTNSEAGELMSADFTVDWNVGDIIHINAYSYGGGSTATVYDMFFLYNRAIVGFGSWTLATGLATVEQVAYSTTNMDP